MLTEDKLNENWDKKGIVKSQILMGDLGHTHNNLLRLACLAELNKFIVSNGSLAVEIPKSKPEDMIHKVFWLSVVMQASSIQAIKNGISEEKNTNTISFTTFNESIIDPNIKYKFLDSRSRS